MKLVTGTLILQTSKNQIRIHQSPQIKVCKKQLGGLSLPQTITFTRTDPWLHTTTLQLLLSIRRERWRDWRQWRHKCLEPPHWLNVQHLHLNHTVTPECFSTDSKHVHTYLGYMVRYFSCIFCIPPLNRSLLLLRRNQVKMPFLASNRTAPAPVAGVFLASSPGSGCACNAMEWTVLSL